MNSIWRQRVSAATWGLALVMACAANAIAQDASMSVSTASSLGVQGGPNPDQGIPIAGWMFYPSIFTGAVFNDNVYNSATNRRSALGVRLSPAFQADLDNGLHKTTVYNNFDLQLYPGLGQRTVFYPSIQTQAAPTNATGRAGFAEIYSPLPDLTVRVLGDVSRNNGLFGSFGGGGSTTSVFIPNATSVTSLGTYSTQFTGSISVEKQITDRTFIVGSTGAQYVNYDTRNVSASLTNLVGPQNPTNGVDYTASLRGGIYITPQIYTFVEGGADIRRYAGSYNDTNGYRVIGGFGSDLISLFRGEIYGGYQQQFSDKGLFPGISSPAFGARLSYYPTRYLTLSVSADETITAGTTPSNFGGIFATTIPGLGGNAARTFQTRGRVDYAFSPYWTAYARAGYGVSNYTNIYRVDTTYGAGAGMTYSFWRNVAVSLDYQFNRTSTRTNAFTNPQAFFIPTTITQNLLSAGVTYRY